MFTYEEMRMIRFALMTEVMRREDSKNPNKEKIKQYDDLYDKVDSIMKEMRIKKEEEEKELSMIHNIVSDAVENLKNRGFHATESTGYYSLKTITEIYDEEEYEYERCVDIFKQKDGEKEYYAIHVVYEDNETDFHYTEHLDAKELEELLKEIYEG